MVIVISFVGRVSLMKHIFHLEVIVTLFYSFIIIIFVCGKEGFFVLLLSEYVG